MVQWVRLVVGVAFPGYAFAQAQVVEEVPPQLKMSDALHFASSAGTLKLAVELRQADPPRVTRPIPWSADGKSLRASDALAVHQGVEPSADVLHLSTTFSRQPASGLPRRDDRNDRPQQSFVAYLSQRESKENLPTFHAVAVDTADPQGSTLGVTTPEYDDEDELPVPAPAQRSPQAPSRAVENDLPDLSAEEWGLAPIRWGGALTTGMNRSFDDDYNVSSSVSQNNSIQASSYVFQPWFAQVNGNANYSTVRSWYRSDNGHEGDNNADGKSYALGGALSLFPMSHFPIQSYYNFSRAKARGEEDQSKSIMTNFGISQSYQPQGTNDSYSYAYNRMSSKMPGPNSMSNVLSGNYSTRIGDEHSITAAASYSDSESGFNDVMNKRVSVNLNHNWLYEEGLNFSNSAFINHTEDDVFQNTDRAKNYSMVSQFNSSFNWQPYDDLDEPLPMVITGTGTLINIDVDAPDSSKNRVTVINGAAALNYRFNEQLMGNANVNMTRLDSNSDQSTTYGGSGSLSYAGAPTQLGDFLHNWSVGTGGSINRSSNAGGTDALSANFGQGISRVFPDMTLTASQSLFGTRTSSFGVINTLSHSIGLSRQLVTGEQATGTLGVNFGHNKTAGKYGGHSNTFTLMGSGQLEVSRRQTLGINANITWMKQVQQKQDISPSLLVINNAVVDIDEARWAGAATFSYTHRAPLDISNSIYTANLMFSSSETSQQATLASFGFGGLPNPNYAPGLKRHWIHSMNFHHTLTYHIGRINLQVLNAVSRVDGVDSVVIFGQLTRNFGNF